MPGFSPYKYYCNKININVWYCLKKLNFDQYVGFWFMVFHKVLKRILFLIQKIYCNVFTWDLFILKTFKIVIDKLLFSSLFSFFFLHKISLFSVFSSFSLFPCLRYVSYLLKKKSFFVRREFFALRIYIYIYFFRYKNGPYNSAKERKVSYWKEKSHLSEVNSLH